MKFQVFAGSFLFLILFTFVSAGQSEKELLLDLRNNLTYNTSVSTKLVHWNESSAFCQWPGVKCDSKSRVSALDLSGEPISGGINDGNSSLFKLVHLQNLSLANTSFASVEFAPTLPSRFGQLTELRHLNLSNSGLSGQVPSDFSDLTRLVVLDLSNTMYTPLELRNPDLRRLISKFIELRELYLDGVNISANGNDWGSAISSSLPNLRVLSLRNSSIKGPFDSSLLNLQSLSVIHLDENSFSSPFPAFFSEFSNLRVFTIGGCDLTGVVPAKLFQMKSLQVIDLGTNSDLGGSLPEFPESIELSYVDLRSCNFSGPVPRSIRNLNRLVYLDLSTNQFSGSVPSFASLKNLQVINLFNNRLRGQIAESLWKGLENLDTLDLSTNSLQGTIPASLFVLPLLKSLSLSSNSFSGPIPVPTTLASSTLQTLDLRANSLEGPIPPFLFEQKILSYLTLASNKFNGSLDLSDLRKLKDLVTFDLSGNNFTGSLDLTRFEEMEKLVSLDLSYNDLSVQVNENVSLSSVFPKLRGLRLASCKLQKIPSLKNQSSLMILDLSDNQLDGEIPNWIWEVGNGNLLEVNLSHNRFTNLQEPYDLRTLNLLDLHSNALCGRIPLPPSFYFLDLSSNNFTSALPPNTGDSLKNAVFISLADNNITGTIPSSFCNTTMLQVLVLSNNSFNGGIPSCLLEKYLAVLNLRDNNLDGDIPDTFPVDCSLETLDLSRNAFQGKVPTSLSRCASIRVLALGNNAINDTFPCWLKSMSRLGVLVLRSNNFRGNIDCLGDDINWPNLQIISLASNNISGVIPGNMFPKLEGLVKEEQKHDHLHTILAFALIYVQDSVSVTLKGREIQLEKILTIFTSIDFSDNNFHGSIPQTVGEMKSLYLLNFSHNALSGHIPPSVGNLKKLGSLDLSFNDLDGEIPTQLGSLTFLSFLNLSYNHLVGRIPHGSQIQTFDEGSFVGNDGLCGFPLNKTCSDGTTLPVSAEDEDSESDIFVSAALGFLFGLGFIFGPLLCCMRWRRWYDDFVRRIVVLLVLRKRNYRRVNKDW